MAKALLGTHAMPRTYQLLDEVRSLRARVADLERALHEAEAALNAREEGQVLRLEDDDEHRVIPLEGSVIA